MAFFRRFEIEIIEDQHDIQNLREESCPICTLPFVIGDSITRMPCCSNSLDPRCLAEWAKTSTHGSSSQSTCPYCRSAFKPDLITYLFPEETAQTALHDTEGKHKELHNHQLSAHHREVFEIIAKANERDQKNLPEAMQKLSGHAWPAVSPGRLQHVRQHLRRLGELNEVLSTNTDQESPDVTFNNVLIVPAPDHGESERIISKGVILRLDYTSIYQEEENATGFRDQIYVYASPQSTVKDLAKAWLKIWVRDSVKPSYMTAWLDQINFDKIPYLFHQRLDRDRWVPLRWEESLAYASTVHSGQISIQEEECTASHMNPTWQKVWYTIQNGYQDSEKIWRMLRELHNQKAKYENSKTLLEGFPRRSPTGALDPTEMVYTQLLIINWEEKYKELQEMKSELFTYDLDFDFDFDFDFDALLDELQVIDAKHEQLERRIHQ